MFYLEHRPSPPLSLFIDRFWYSTGRPAHRRERLLPSGNIQLVINLAHDHCLDYGPDGNSAQKLAPFLIAGVHSQYIVVDTADLDEMIGVQFRPGGFMPFFSIPADEFSNAQTALDSVWSASAGELRSRVRTAEGPQAKLRVLESEMKSRLSGDAARHAAVDFALAQFHRKPEASRIAAVTDQIGLSPRRFAQVFREQVGVTPKLYCRMRRFQQVLGLIRTGREVSWTDVALSCGYFDQSHFVNDFRAFSGITPSSYLAGRTLWTNHVVMTD